MKYSKLSLSGKVIFSSVVSFGFLALVALVATLSVNTLTSTNKWVDHTHNVIQESLLIEAAAVNMETGMRGYLLAGKEEFLEPFKSGSKDFLERIKKLRTTVSDNPPQVELLSETEATINDWLEVVVKPTIQLRRDIGEAKSMEDMEAWVQEERGKRFFDKFRGQIATFIEREQKLLDQRQKKLSRANRISQFRDNNKWVIHTYKVIGEAQNLLSSAIDMETGMRGFLLAGKDSFLEPYENGWRRFNRISSELKNTVSDNPAQVRLLSDIQETIGSWREDVVMKSISLRRIIGNSKSMEDMAALVAEARGKKYFDKFRNQIATFRAKEAALMIKRQESAASTVVQSYVFIAISIILALLTSTFLTMLLRNTVHDFGGLVRELSQTAGVVSGAAVNISGASRNLSSNSNHQAAAVEETSTSMEQLSGIVRNNVRLTESSKDLSDNVKDQMEELTEAMKQIRESNESIEGLAKVIEEIGDKTSVIDEIVFQTQLLSFNASVEAERAGEHGRGFSVVAQEVGSLAQMSGKAALEISQIVKESTEQVKRIAKENGMRVERGDRIAEETRKQAESVSKGAGQVLNASSEQERGMNQIKQAIQSINRSTQQIASIAGQAANSSQNLEDQSTVLNQFVDEINLFLKGQDDSGSKTSVNSQLGSPVRLVHTANEAKPSQQNNVTRQPFSEMKQAAGAEFTPTEEGTDNDDGWKQI